MKVEDFMPNNVVSLDEARTAKTTPEPTTEVDPRDAHMRALLNIPDDQPNYLLEIAKHKSHEAFMASLERDGENFIIPNEMVRQALAGAVLNALAFETTFPLTDAEFDSIYEPLMLAELAYSTGNLGEAMRQMTLVHAPMTALSAKYG